METKQHALKKPMGQKWNQRRNQKIPVDKQKWKHNLTKSMRCSKSSSKRVHSNTGLPQKTRKILNKQPKLPPKRIIEEQTKPKVNIRKKIMKISEEINKIETKKTIEKINKSKN